MMERLSQFCASLRYRDLPEAVRERTKMLVADSLTNIISGLSLPIAPVVYAYVLEQGGRPESSLIGARRLPSTQVVFTHSAIASATQCDDTHNRSVTHVSSSVVPAALAVCESQGLGGKTLIESVVAGVEVMARVGLALNPRELYRRGIHPSSLTASFGTAATSGKAFGFTGKEFFQAFGLAAVQASGLLCGSEKGPLSWYIQYGKGAEKGIAASGLVRLGANAPENLFNDRRGFFRVFSDRPNLSFLRRDLGRRFAIQEVSQKRYPCFQFGQSALEAFFRITKEQMFQFREINRMDVYIPSAASKEIFLGEKFELPPRTVLSAQTNLRFLLGLAAVFGRVSLDDHVHERKNPAVNSVAQKVQVKGDDELNRVFPGTWPAKVEVHVKGKRILSASVLYPKGDWRNPMSWEQLQEKFLQLVQKKISPKRSKEIWNWLIHVEELRNIKDLFPRRIHVQS